jgi:hypothetical protein
MDLFHPWSRVPFSYLRFVAKLLLSCSGAVEQLLRSSEQNQREDHQAGTTLQRRLAAGCPDFFFFFFPAHPTTAVVKTKANHNHNMSSAPPLVTRLFVWRSPDAAAEIDIADAVITIPPRNARAGVPLFAQLRSHGLSL